MTDNKGEEKATYQDCLEAAKAMLMVQENISPVRGAPRYDHRHRPGNNGYVLN